MVNIEKVCEKMVQKEKVEKIDQNGIYYHESQHGWERLQGVKRERKETVMDASLDSLDSVGFSGPQIQQNPMVGFPNPK